VSEINAGQPIEAFHVWGDKMSAATDSTISHWKLVASDEDEARVQVQVRLPRSHDNTAGDVYFFRTHVFLLKNGRGKDVAASILGDNEIYVSSTVVPTIQGISPIRRSFFGLETVTAVAMRRRVLVFGTSSGRLIVFCYSNATKKPLTEKLTLTDVYRFKCPDVCLKVYSEPVAAVDVGFAGKEVTFYSYFKQSNRMEVCGK
jgi:hypothetical protein